jgi:periplasmic divalent cation tolerance protein
MDQPSKQGQVMPDTTPATAAVTTPEAATTDDVVLIYATAPDEATAETIATTLLEARLIACANIWPGMTALYRWQGKIGRDREVVVILKTRASLAEAAIQAARAQHPYDTPAFIVLPTSGGHASFLDWVRTETI